MSLLLVRGCSNKSFLWARPDFIEIKGTCKFREFPWGEDLIPVEYTIGINVHTVIIRRSKVHYHENSGTKRRITVLLVKFVTPRTLEGSPKLVKLKAEFSGDLNNFDLEVPFVFMCVFKK